MKISADAERFKAIVRNKVKSNLGKFVSNEHLIGQQGGKSIKIPISNIITPRFTFGGMNGGAGSGSGENGDPIDGSGNKKSKGKPSEEEGDGLVSEFSPEELADMISEELSLPKLEPKGKGSISQDKKRYNSIAINGSESLRHNKRTYKEALKRNISSGSYDPFNPKIIPIKNDKRYKSGSPEELPEISATVISIIDTSGSMQDEQRHIAKSISFWIDLLLNKAYKNVNNVFIIHDTTAKEVERDEFFSASSDGGTRISSAYKLCADLMETEYPFAEENIYIFNYTDGDNLNNDNEVALDILNNRILPNCNQFCYGQVRSPHGSGEFIEKLKFFEQRDNFISAQMNDASDILQTIRLFFERGK